MLGTPLEDTICIVIVLCVMSGYVGTLDFRLPTTRIYMGMCVTVLVMDLMDLLYLLGEDGYSFIYSQEGQRLAHALVRGLRHIPACVFLCLMGWLLAYILKGHSHSLGIAKGMTFLCILCSLSLFVSGCLFSYCLDGKFYRGTLVLNTIGFLGVDGMRVVCCFLILWNVRRLWMFHFLSLLLFMFMPFQTMMSYLTLSNYPEILQGTSHSCGLFFSILARMSLHPPIIYSLSLLIYFVLLQVDMGRRVQKMKLELATNRLKMAVGFVQPHFLYNALTSIYYLCDKDPQAAKQNIGDFANYLRGSMMGITGRPLIPFERELDHVRYYLHLEQLRFGDEIQARFDIQELDFQVPALSVEHLVENAVKHGIYEKEKGGTVWVTSFSTPIEYHVCVEDDGVGFDKKILKDLDPSHFGLNVVEEILGSMCQGRLKISSELGKGTRVELVIPRREERRNENHSGR